MCVCRLKMTLKILRLFVRFGQRPIKFTKTIGLLGNFSFFAFIDTFMTDLYSFLFFFLHSAFDQYLSGHLYYYMWAWFLICSQSNGYFLCLSFSFASTRLKSLSLNVLINLSANAGWPLVLYNWMPSSSTYCLKSLLAIAFHGFASEMESFRNETSEEPHWNHFVDIQRKCVT